MNDIIVSFRDSTEICSTARTSWTRNDKSVIHFIDSDTFLCCVKQTGELLKETNSLSDALTWLSALD
jgi:hypothetical protein